MEPKIQQKIINNLQSLNSNRLLEVLDFVEFLHSKQESSLPDPKIIDSVCGKYKNFLSSSDDFSQKKQEEKKLEDDKWKTR
jgi:hypothetical protein